MGKQIALHAAGAFASMFALVLATEAAFGALCLIEDRRRKAGKSLLS